VATFADKGYRGARGAVGVPFYGRHLPTRMREVNSAHAKIRSIGERAIATLNWKVLTKLHCCPQRAASYDRHSYTTASATRPPSTSQPSCRAPAPRHGYPT